MDDGKTMVFGLSSTVCFASVVALVVTEPVSNERSQYSCIRGLIRG